MVKLKCKKSKYNKTIKASTKPPFPIDVVYTWKGEDTSENVRFSNNNELQYSLRSVEMFIPWVNKIFILMNPPKKIPSWIKESEKTNKKIIILDHFDTFPDKKYLPSINSNAIEITLPYIKELSEHFIYLNDDIFLGKPCPYTNFFTPDGKAVLSFKTLINKTKKHKGKPNKTVRNIKFPPNTGMMYNHIPIVRLKSVCLEFNKEYKLYIEWILANKKRRYQGWDKCIKYNLPSPCQQIHYPIAKYMYKKGKGILVDDTSRYYYVQTSSIQKSDSNIIPNIDSIRCLSDEMVFKEKLENLEKLRPYYFCINDTEEVVKMRKIKRKIMLSFLKKYYSKKPYFEK